ncbi:MAG: hypothetical protein ACOX22_10005 [Caldicoprobacterales bacterium]|mgnify:FL=1
MNKKFRAQKARSRRKASPLAGNYIIPTEHAISRYQQRIRKMCPQKIQHAIIEDVKRSRLIAFTKYGGREIRENRGIVFVCELHGDYLYVITVLLSEVDLRFVM